MTEFYMIIIYKCEPSLFFQTEEIPSCKPLKKKNKAPLPDKSCYFYRKRKKENCCKMHNTVNFTTIPFLCFFLERY